MPRTLQVLRPYNTTVKVNDEGETIVTLYSTDIVKFYSVCDSIVIELKTDSYITPTTARRMNEASAQFNLVFRVNIKQGLMVVSFDAQPGLRHTFHDSIKFRKNGQLISSN